MLKWIFAFSSFFHSHIEIDGHPLAVEIAKSHAERIRGLSGRHSLPENQGMLFIFDEPHLLSFWMKDTEIPLSIAFFDRDGKLLEVEEMRPLYPEEKKTPIYKSKTAALYAIETNAGWFQKHKIQKGAQLTFIQGKP
jgi:uncharacterized membrane protein (UPF0127 family)